MPKDYYQILEIDKSASTEDIKKAYKKLAKKYHPDLNKDPGSEIKFKNINEAYQVLGDEEKRRSYDQFGSADYSDNFSSSSGGDPFDIFNDFFSQSGGNGFDDMFGSFNQGKRSNREDAPKTVKQHIYISFLDSIKGCIYKMSYKGNEICGDCRGKKSYEGDPKYIEHCSNCNGSGVEMVQVRSPFGILNTQQKCRKCYGVGEKISKVCKNCKGKGFLDKTKNVDIKIPSGVHDQEVLMFSDSSYHSQKIYLEVNVKKSHIFERKNSDIYTKIIIHPFTAIFGGNSEAPTPEEVKIIKIPAGTQCGEYLKLKGMGVKGNSKFSSGDLYIKIEFAPFKLSSAEMEILKKIKIEEPKEGRKWIDFAKKEIKNN